MFYNLLFDLNRDGRIDAAEWAIMDSVINPECAELNEEDEIEDELEMCGLDYDEFVDTDMDEDARLEAFEDVGLDSDDFHEY